MLLESGKIYSSYPKFYTKFVNKLKATALFAFERRTGLSEMLHVQCNIKSPSMYIVMWFGIL